MEIFEGSALLTETGIWLVWKYVRVSLEKSLTRHGADQNRHCGAGCISGCPSGPPPTSSATAPRSDGQCGAVSSELHRESLVLTFQKFGGATCDPKGQYGGCCSQYGWVMVLIVFPFRSLLAVYTYHLPDHLFLKILWIYP